MIASSSAVYGVGFHVESIDKCVSVFVVQLFTSVFGCSAGSVCCVVVMVLTAGCSLICSVALTSLLLLNRCAIGSKSSGSTSGSPKRFFASHVAACSVYMILSFPPVAFFLPVVLSATKNSR